jgi:hypothetical protein
MPRSGSIVVSSITYGTANSSMFTYNPLPMVTSVSPSVVPLAGNTLVTVMGTNLDGAASSVYLAGVMATVQRAASNNTVLVVMAGVASDARFGFITVVSPSFGNSTSTMLSTRFTYANAGTLVNVMPPSGRVAGGYLVTIHVRSCLSRSLSFAGSMLLVGVLILFNRVLSCAAAWPT